MIEYSEYSLPSGLTLLAHNDATTPMVTVNVLYAAGARDEDPSHTGFAHLLEHLLFSGTERYPDYDLVVNRMGGENNAFTNNDYTNYYLTVPAEALEQAIDLEVDRILNFDVTPRALEVQRQVVTEEYKQRYLGQPYGDVWLELRRLCYTTHPYRWAAIGADIAHVQQATVDEVRRFHRRLYTPANAIMAVCGNIGSPDRVAEMVARRLPATAACPEPRCLPAEPTQVERRVLELSREVPTPAIYKAYHIGPRLSRDYYVGDRLTDVLANGQSARLYDALVRQEWLMIEPNAYITGDLDPGLLVVCGKLRPGVTQAQAEQAIDAVLHRLSTEGPTEYELQKAQNNYEANFLFSQYKPADRAFGLCYYRLLGHPEWVNTEPDNYRDLSADELRLMANRLFVPEAESVIYYNIVS
ncbi:MAG: insulinase family protein [Bacteroidales bacterium]|nr:insulinase family protein [Bacteroidales bacterium]